MSPLYSKLSNSVLSKVLPLTFRVLDLASFPVSPCSALPTSLQPSWPPQTPTHLPQGLCPCSFLHTIVFSHISLWLAPLLPSGLYSDVTLSLQSALCTLQNIVASPPCVVQLLILLYFSPSHLELSYKLLSYVFIHFVYHPSLEHKLQEDRIELSSTQNNTKHCLCIGIFNVIPKG